MTEGKYYPPPAESASPQKLSLWQKFKRWPLVARIGTIGCGGLIVIFGGLLILGLILQAVDPEGMDDIREEQQQEREEREAEEAAEEAAEAEREAEEERQAEEEAAAEREAEEEAERQREQEEAERQAEEEDDQVEVPDVVGQTGDEAQDALEDAGFDADFHAEDSSVWSPANWEVEATEPVAGEMADEGVEVVVNVVRPEEDEDEDESEEDDEQAAEQDEAEIPEGIDAQIALLSEVRDFDEAEIYFSEGDESFPYSTVEVSVEVDPGWSESSMCRSARAQTMDGLEFMRDRVTDDYDQVRFSYHARSEQDATGDSSILPMAAVTYAHDTVQAIDDSAVTIDNVWPAADEGGEALVCQRAD